MKPIFEKIDPSPGSSFHIARYEGDHLCSASFWHVHPEYELVYIESGRGRRHIGQHVSYYDQGDLIFLGPSIPHSAFSNQDYPNNIEIVIQFSESFLNQGLASLPEFYAIQSICNRSRQGISFYGSTKERVGELLKSLSDLEPLPRFLRFIEILYDLSKSNDYQLLQVEDMALEIHSNDYERIQKIYDFVSQHYSQAISLQKIADLSGLSTNAFCRFFKKVTERTFVQFLNEYRIHKTCDLMRQKNTSLSEIMYACGFNDLAYYSRQFKKVMGMSPREYRRQLHQLPRSV